MTTVGGGGGGTRPVLSRPPRPTRWRGGGGDDVSYAKDGCARAPHWEREKPSGVHLAPVVSGVVHVMYTHKYTHETVRVLERVPTTRALLRRVGGTPGARYAVHDANDKTSARRPGGGGVTPRARVTTGSAGEENGWPGTCVDSCADRRRVFPNNVPG